MEKKHLGLNDLLPESFLWKGPCWTLNELRSQVQTGSATKLLLVDGFIVETVDYIKHHVSIPDAIQISKNNRVHF